MKVQVSEIQSGQHMWVRDELWLVASVRQSALTGTYTVTRSTGAVAVFAADAMVQV